MFFIHFMLISILSWIYAVECMEVIPERAEKIYVNPKYVYPNATVTVRRYSRKSKYYINVAGTIKRTFTNNVTLSMSISQFLHNEYRRSFVSLSYKFCDLINNEPYIGAALKKVGLVCPLPPGFHNMANITAQTEHFPNVFPFEKGRMEVTMNVTDTMEPIFQLNVYASFKQKFEKKYAGIL